MCKILFLWIILIQLLALSTLAYDVIYAVNSGGDTHTDVNDVDYAKDTNTEGEAVTYSSSITITGIRPEDYILYQTVRWDPTRTTFSHDVPVAGEGQYVLILKFIENHHHVNNGRVFNVIFNRDHRALSHLDNHKEVGYATPNDKAIYFTIVGNKVMYKEQTSALVNGKVSVAFESVKDGALICALVLYKGDVENVLNTRSTSTEVAEQLRQHESKETSKGSAFIFNVHNSTLFINNYFNAGRLEKKQLINEEEL